ncbi:MAG: hypothetical protein WBW92_01315 [Rhodanobacteraceae bacterium]
MKSGRIASLLATAALALLVASPAVVAKDKKEVLYPNAKREQPKLDLRSQRDATKLNEALDAANAGEDAKAEELLQPLADGSATKSKYAQAMALQGLANLRYQQGKLKEAIKLMQSSLDLGVMPNDTYFQLMYGLVQFYVADQQYETAETKLHEWRKQGQRETAQSYALEGNIDYRLQKYPEAIAAIKKAKELNTKEGKTDNPATWDQILAASYAESGDTDDAVAMAKKRVAADPTDTTSLRNAVSLLVQAQRYTEAADLMETASKNGAVETSKDYITMAKLYMVLAQNSDEPAPKAKKAVQVLEDGLSSGKMKPGYEVYKLQGDASYLGDDYDKALAYYKKAAPFAKNGELDVRRGQILASQGKNNSAIKFIKSGIAKGVEHEGNAYLLLGAANSNAKHRAAAIAAMKKAAQYPETKAKATRWLKKAGAA